MYIRNWVITCQRFGFKYKIFVYGNEDELRDYIHTELPEAVSYSGATDKEIDAARALGLCIYLI